MFFLRALNIRTCLGVLDKWSSPLITLDQLRLLKYDNVKTGKYKTNRDFGLNADLKFENEIKKYSYMWTERGEYSRN